MWFIALFISILFWIRIKNTEEKDKEIKNSYKLESVQNQMFTLFSQWLRANFQNLEHKNDKLYIIFTKDDLIHFLMNKYESLKNQLYRTKNSYDRVKKIEEVIRRENEQEELPLLVAALRSHTFNFAPKSGEIDLETAQIISELIITRLKSRNLINLSKEKSLSDKFVFEFKH